MRVTTSAARVAATGGSVSHFKDARYFASWFGLTPKGCSSGSTRKLGRIAKQGDRYLLLTHGARALLRAAELARRAGKSLDDLPPWATEVQARMHHNKAAGALANKLILPNGIKAHHLSVLKIARFTCQKAVLTFVDDKWIL